MAIHFFRINFAVEECNLQSEQSGEFRVTGTHLKAASPMKTALASAASFIFPGLGHIILGKAVRGLLIGAGILTMFGLGFWMKGILHQPVAGEWLTYLFSFCNVGIGLPYFICKLLNFGFVLTASQPAEITFDYGKTFLLVSGLLNYLAALDAFDISVGRKA
jgi:hypothetical protein